MLIFGSIGLGYWKKPVRASEADLKDGFILGDTIRLLNLWRTDEKFTIARPLPAYHALFYGVAINFIFFEVILPRIGLRGLNRRSRPNRYRRAAAQFRSLAIRMGGVMIKVGQFLLPGWMSSRPKLRKNWPACRMKFLRKI